MNLTEVSSTQRFKEVTINENFESIDYSSVYGKRLPASVALTWAYWGGRWGGFAVSAGTLTLSNNADNYIVVLRSTGVISVSTSATNWNNTTDYARVYKVTTAGSLVTAVEDHRAGPGGVQGPSAVTVSGPSSATDNAIARYDGTTGKLLQNSVVTISDTGAIAGAISLSISQGTITDPANAFTVATTWNDAADTFVAASIDVTDTASATASLLQRWRVGGSTLASINKAGALSLAAGSASLPSLYFSTNTTTGLYQSLANRIGVAVSGNHVMNITSTAVMFSPTATAGLSYGGITPSCQVNGDSSSTSSFGISAWVANTTTPRFFAAKSRGAAIGTHTIVTNGEDLFRYDVLGSDGAAFQTAVSLIFECDAAPSTGIVPGRFSIQTADTAGVLQEALRVTNAQKLLIAHTAAVTIGQSSRVQISGDGTNPSGLSIGRWSADASGTMLAFGKSRHATIGSNTIVQDGDALGSINFYGNDGSNYDAAAQIICEVDGTPGSGTDMPGRLRFLTSPDGTATLTERLRIDNAGNVVVNTAAIATNATNGFLYVPSCAGTPTGTPTTYTGRVPIVVDSTNHKLYFYDGSWRDAGP